MFSLSHNLRFIFAWNSFLNFCFAQNLTSKIMFVESISLIYIIIFNHCLLDFAYNQNKWKISIVIFTFAFVWIQKKTNIFLLFCLQYWIFITLWCVFFLFLLFVSHLFAFAWNINFWILLVVFQTNKLL